MAGQCKNMLRVSIKRTICHQQLPWSTVADVKCQTDSGRTSCFHLLTLQLPIHSAGIVSHPGLLSEMGVNQKNYTSSCGCNVHNAKINQSNTVFA